MTEPTVSLVFPAYNRLEFTKQSWWALQNNTDWSLVKEFHVYDDGSTDGTREWLQRQHGWIDPIWHLTSFRSPMGVTLDWIQSANAPILAKLDNDTIYPPDWLNIALEVMERNPSLSMLGLECMRQPARFRQEPPVAYGYTGEDNYLPARFGYLPAKFISGLGIYRAAAFKRSLPNDGGYFGLEEWQMVQHGMKYGWILPSLPVFLLDRMPAEPWASLSAEYVRAGWQRPWSLDLRYKPDQCAMWNWWTPFEEGEI